MSTRNGVIGGIIGAGVVAGLGMAAGAVQLDPPDGPIGETTASINEVLAALQASGSEQGWSVASLKGTDEQILIEGSGVLHRIIVVPQASTASANYGVIANFQVQIDDLVVVGVADGSPSSSNNHSVVALGEITNPEANGLGFSSYQSALNPTNIRFEQQAVINWSTIPGGTRSRGPARVIVLYRLDQTP